MFKIKPFIIFPDGAVQDILVTGPKPWLINSKDTVNTLYAAQPNPRIKFASSFVAGHHEGFAFFARSYYVDLEEIGTERRGALLTVGLAARKLPITTLAWAYMIGFVACVSSSLNDFMHGQAWSEDEAIARYVEKHGHNSGRYLADAFEALFHSAVERGVIWPRFALSRAHTRIAGGKNAAIVLDNRAGRDALYGVAIAMMRRSIGRWFKRSVVNNVFVFREAHSDGEQPIVVNVGAATAGVAEITLQTVGHALREFGSAAVYDPYQDRYGA